MSSNTHTWPEQLAAAGLAQDRAAGLNALFISFWGCLAVVVALLVASEDLRHWFIVPVTLCGILIGSDAVAWFLGEVDVFDPVGIMGLLGLHLFFAAPFLHVLLNTWMFSPAPPEDWRDWLGLMACLNFLGLAVYRWSRTLPGRFAFRPACRMLQTGRSTGVLFFALCATGAMQALIYVRFGGIAGYIDAYVNHPEMFTGAGWQFMISESFPILGMMAFAIFARSRGWRLGNFQVAGILVVFCAVQMLFGGLRGSRSNTIWALFWATGIIHFWLRPVRRSFIGIGLVFLVLFTYAYGFYKEAGTAGKDVAGVMELGRKRGRTLDGMLLGDFGRADVQAFVLYRLTAPGNDYEYAWGKTYLGAVSLLIPRALWPDRPATIVRAGTDAQHYMGAYAPRVQESSKVYGLAGETMLNFGPLAVPFSFAVFGLCVGFVRRLLLTLRASDCRLMILPFLVNLCFPVLIGDSDNIIFFLLKQGLVPVLVIGACAARVVRREA